MSEPSREAEILRAIIDNDGYDKSPQSRNEEILLSILNNTEYGKEPQSRIEELYLELKDKGGGGGDLFYCANIIQNIPNTSTIQSNFIVEGGSTE